ncbi:hypothetical protein [Dokdonella ginsengisoli]|uniref:Uncharacterized protein n=1 Tax=Dokdonella ginsengisoli TaxID=363846 RepID=A0ABV9QYJ7_9GAMM
MSYDIGIGRCTEVSGDTVVVKLESVMVKRLSPDQPWQRSGTSLLRLNRNLCSAERPPQPDRELYVSRSALSKRSMASLDLAGDGETVSVDLRALLNDLDPQPSAGPSAKGGRTADRKAQAR